MLSLHLLVESRGQRARNRNRRAAETDELPLCRWNRRNKETLIQPHDAMDKDGERRQTTRGEEPKQETKLTADGKRLAPFPRSARDLPSSLTEPWPPPTGRASWCRFTIGEQSRRADGALLLERADGTCLRLEKWETDKDGARGERVESWKK